MTPEEKKEHFKRAMSNYQPVMEKIDQLHQDYPETKVEVFPENWKDPLELYGSSRKALEIEGTDVNEERQALILLMEDKRFTPEYVWEIRRHLVGERLFIRDFMGL